MIGDLHIGDAGLVKGDLHGHVAVVTGGGSGVGAGRIAGGGGVLLLTHGLIQALLHGGLDRVAGDGGAGDAVYLSGLGLQNGLLHGLPHVGAVAGCLAGHVDGHVGDLIFADGHGHLDRTLHALGFGAVCAGRIEDRGCEGRLAAGRRLSTAAGSQGEHHGQRERKSDELLSFHSIYLLDIF